MPGVYMYTHMYIYKHVCGRSGNGGIATARHEEMQNGAGRKPEGVTRYVYAYKYIYIYIYTYSYIIYGIYTYIHLI